MKEAYLMAYLTSYVSFLVAPVLDAFSVSILCKKKKKTMSHKRQRSPIINYVLSCILRNNNASSIIINNPVR